MDEVRTRTRVDDTPFPLTLHSLGAYSCLESMICIAYKHGITATLLHFFCQQDDGCQSAWASRLDSGIGVFLLRDDFESI
jgi:hypothetical protein